MIQAMVNRIEDSNIEKNIIKNHLLKTVILLHKELQSSSKKTIVSVKPETEDTDWHTFTKD